MRQIPSIFMLALVAGTALASGQDIPLRVTSISPAMKHDPFYKKHISANGYPVVSSGAVSDYGRSTPSARVTLTVFANPRLKASLYQLPVHLAPFHVATLPQPGYAGRKAEVGGTCGKCTIWYAFAQNRKEA